MIFWNFLLGPRFGIAPKTENTEIHLSCQFRRLCEPNYRPWSQNPFKLLRNQIINVRNFFKKMEIFLIYDNITN